MINISDTHSANDALTMLSEAVDKLKLKLADAQKIAVLQSVSTEARVEVMKDLLGQVRDELVLFGVSGDQDVASKYEEVIAELQVKYAELQNKLDSQKPKKKKRRERDGDD